MSGFFEQNFGGVRDMLERERESSNRAGEAASANGLPWKLMQLNLGKPAVLSSHRTEQDARDAMAQVHRTCAPFIRDSFWVEERP